MTRLGADATSETIAELKALGVTLVSRYVSDFPTKNLTLAEAKRLTAAQIDLITNWENDVNDWVGGYDQGVAYAQRAYAQHVACGGRTDELYPYWGIYFSVDQSVDPNDPTVHGYFQGINHVLTPRHTGCYGQTSLLRKLHSLGLIACGDRGGTWRSMSSFGLPEGLGNPGEFDIEQTGQYNSQYDRDVVNSVNAGQWRVGVMPVPIIKPQETDMILHDITGSPEVWALSGSLYWHVVDTASLSDYVKAGVPRAAITAAEHAAILAAVVAAKASVTVTVDASQLVTAVKAAFTDPVLLAAQGAALAHAEAVQEHQDTPAS